MFQLLCPDLSVDSLFAVDMNALQEQGISGLILDLDNTLVEWDCQDIPPAVIQWCQMVQAMGFKLILVSNNKRERVRIAAECLAIPFVARALKPLNGSFIQAAAALELAPSHIAVIGDQLFTDVLGGNRMGFYTILVSSLSNNEFIGTRLTRQFEKIAVRVLRAKGLIK